MSKPEIDQDIISEAEDVIFDDNAFDWEMRPEHSCIADIKRMDRRLVRVKRLLNLDHAHNVDMMTDYSQMGRDNKSDYSGTIPLKLKAKKGSAKSSQNSSVLDSQTIQL